MKACPSAAWGARSRAKDRAAAAAAVKDMVRLFGARGLRRGVHRRLEMALLGQVQPVSRVRSGRGRRCGGSVPAKTPGRGGARSLAPIVLSERNNLDVQAVCSPRYPRPVDCQGGCCTGRVCPKLFAAQQTLTNSNNDWKCGRFEGQSLQHAAPTSNFLPSSAGPLPGPATLARWHLQYPAQANPPGGAWPRRGGEA